MKRKMDRYDHLTQETRRSTVRLYRGSPGLPNPRRA